jgi:hypothetical protein
LTKAITESANKGRDIFVGASGGHGNTARNGLCNIDLGPFRFRTGRINNNIIIIIIIIIRFPRSIGTE